MENQTSNQQQYNNNTTWTINTDDLNFLERIDCISHKMLDNMYNKNTTWTTNDQKENK